jgi:hypothetical protein
VQNISKLDIRITVNVPAVSGETSLWLRDVDEVWRGEIEFTHRIDLPHPEGLMDLLPGAIPTHGRLLAFLDTQRERLPNLESLIINVGLSVARSYNDSFAFNFWSYCYSRGREPEAQWCPTRWTLIEDGSSTEGWDQERLSVARQGIWRARHQRSRFIEQARHALEESELWGTGYGMLR